jgi:hypothetical protein
VVEPGSALLSWRTARFEVWAIDAIADRLAADADVRRWIPPRRNHAGIPTDLDPADQELCARCDGRPAHEVGSLEDIEWLVKRGVLLLAFRVPVGPHPERDLREQVHAIGHPAVQSRCLPVLDELHAALAAVQEWAGDPDAVAARTEDHRRPHGAAPGNVDLRGHRRSMGSPDGRTPRRRPSVGVRSGHAAMLPDPDHAWLTDAEGRRYTSELRVTAVGIAREASNLV